MQGAAEVLMVPKMMFLMVVRPGVSQSVELLQRWLVLPGSAATRGEYAVAWKEAGMGIPVGNAFCLKLQSIINVGDQCGTHWLCSAHVDGSLSARVGSGGRPAAFTAQWAIVGFCYPRQTPVWDLQFWLYCRVKVCSSFCSWVGSWDVLNTQKIVPIPALVPCLRLEPDSAFLLFLILLLLAARGRSACSHPPLAPARCNTDPDCAELRLHGLGMAPKR